MASADEIASMTVTKLVTNSSYKAMIKELFVELMDPFVKEVKDLKDEVEKLKGDVLDLQSDNKKLLKANKKYEKRIKGMEVMDFERKLDMIDLDQRKYKNSIMVTGIQEQNEEDAGKEDTDKVIADLIKDKLDIEVSVGDISSSHRAKQQEQTKRKKAGPRPIFVDFTRYSVRRRVIQARRKLKGSGVGISEVLSPGRKELLEETQRLVDHFSQAKACWTWEGIVRMIIMEDGATAERRVNVNSYRDVNYWAGKFGYRPDGFSDDEEK